VFEMSYITTVRARLRDADPAAAQERHNGIVARLRPTLEPAGGIGHMVFANAQDPGEFLAVDRWETIEALQRFMGDPSVQQEIGSLFDGPPDVSVWAVRDGWTAY
jgi:quinol monooxygenase YgiN